VGNANTTNKAHRISVDPKQAYHCVFCSKEIDARKIGFVLIFL
jgi:hypothetical protein